MDYSELKTSLETYLVIQDATGVANFESILPRIIEYAEKRIYRELDLLATRTSDSTGTSTAGSRAVPIPDALLVIEGLAIITPAGAFPTDSGAQRIPLLRTTRAFIDTTWPIESNTKAPAPFETYYAVFSEEEQAGEGSALIPNNAIIAPTPDGNYHVEFTGTFRPAPLSSNNPNTVLTETFPDLFFAASMIASLSYQRDFGSSSSDPQASMSWEKLYMDLREAAILEEGQKKSASQMGTAIRPHQLSRIGVSAPAQQNPQGG